MNLDVVDSSAMEVGVAPRGWLASTHLELFPTKDAATVLGMAACLPLLRWVLEAVLFTPIANALLIHGRQVSSKLVPDKLRSRMDKLVESQWKLFCYTSLTALGVWATHNQPWLTDTSQLWAGWPNQAMTGPMRLLYASELAYYLATIMMLALWEVPRKDYHVMMTHHFATVVLITCSYKYNYTRVGCVIMLLHDINDVLMETAKSLNYARFDLAATTIFASFVASWAGLRIYAFPAYIIRSTLLEVTHELGYRPPHYLLMNALLLALYAIHLYWFCLILRIAWIKLTTGQAKDIREDDDDGSDED